MPTQSFRKLIATLAGPAIFFIILNLPAVEGLSANAQSVLATTSWVAIWWITEAIPIPITSLLPIILFPITGAAPLSTTTAAYGNSIIYLYLGGFVLALALERWNLHKRIALLTVYFIGTNPEKIILGFMFASFFISMWISNTATTMMMMPIALAVARQIENSIAGRSSNSLSKTFGLPLMLGIAYASSIGGISTLIGTPTNAMFAAIVRDLHHQEVDFANWMTLAFPISFVLLFICWILLVKIIFRVSTAETSHHNSIIREELRALGPLSTDEKKVLFVFLFTSLSWMTSSLILKRVIPAIDDTIIAIFAVFLLFLIPSSNKGDRLMNWDTAKKLPWDILLLFGGGLALAAGFQTSGLAAWLGSLLKEQGISNYILILITVSFMVNFLTEVTSNVAVATILLPIISSTAIAMGFHPYPLMVAVTISASCAFMLPVATPPNAVVFSTGYIRIGQMARAGFILNIVSVAIVVLAIWLLLPAIWNIDPFTVPDFAR